ncbi:maleylpyruvate isomerase N-terminal domain-containing protein [Planobispora siamensis]|uniref:Mycothiol-dependent maleylpyruvate isomerase metal-binding domain-containing protein n=1 Tax=Planobispora siamensis TaxID=936338 RepID=A0A8J3SLD8_9ACTN|nr:maleylpyruvate isomerase N-terminal domain-containing protein [Planobispora siamensis]GIH96566.1 hypothetical protein Psi01_71960 [Planobispora siamensis]
MDETNAFLHALTTREPDDPTACDGWRVRDLVAHIVAGAKEEAELIEDALRGVPGRPTRPFPEREAAYAAMPYPELLSALALEGVRLNAAVQALAAAGGTVEFTGALMTGADFRMHGRSELALHRRDLVGDDEVGRCLLAQPELTAHAVKVLTVMSTLQESIATRAARAAGAPAGFAFRMRSPGRDDVVVRVAPTPSLQTAPPGDELPVVLCSAADRLLALWGRRPAGELDMSRNPDVRALVESVLYL